MATEPQGVVEDGWGAVADAFREVLDRPQSGAAAVAVHDGGRLVVDLRGGADPVTGATFQEDSLMLVASCTKGVTATVLGMLVERGVVDPDERVAHYWPEYGVRGKEATTVAMVASHRAGLPFPPVGSGLRGLDFHRGPALVAALADAEPLWEPGTAMAYHSTTYGTLLGEIVRRASGRTVGELVGELIREPLGADVWIGLPEQQVHRLLPGRWTVDLRAATADPDPAPGTYAAIRAASLAEAPAPEPDWSDRDSVAAWAGAEIPAGNGATNARALSRMYAATLGEVDGVRLYGEETRRRLTTPLTDDVPSLVEQGTTGPSIRFGLGYQLSSPSMPGLGPRTYGHTGAGGRLGIADPDTGLSFGFVCGRMELIGPDGNDRWTRLLDAVKSARG